MRRRTRRGTLAFVDPASEALFAAESLKKTGALVRWVLILQAMTLGLSIPGYLMSSRPTLYKAIVVLLFILFTSALLLIMKTKTGRRHQPEVIAAVGCVLCCMMIALFSAILIKKSPGQLREPISGVAIPECTTAVFSVTTHPSSANFTSSIAYGNLFYTGQACHYTTPDGEQRVVEMKIWAAKHYDRDAYQYQYFAVAVWGIWSLGSVLLLSMRFVHAVTAVGLPGLVLWCVRCATFDDPASIVFDTALVYVPAFLMIVIASWKLERTCSSRSLFLERQNVKQLLMEKDQSIKKGLSKVFKMEQQLNDARKTVNRVMAAESAALRPFELPYSDLDWGGEERKSLGEGAFGTVYKATLRGEHAVAVKTMRVSKVMSPLHHPNLVKLWGGVWNEGVDKLCIVLEFCPEGSLKSFLQSNEGHSWFCTYHRIAQGIALCFQYLHHEQPTGEPLIHRDLKPDNVLVTKDLSAKVADFGESKSLNVKEAKEEGRDVQTMTLVGTPLYAAPEVVKLLPYNEKVDVYSFAVTLFELAHEDSSLALDQFRRVGGATAVLRNWRPNASAALREANPALWELIQSCWNPEPHLRPSFGMDGGIAQSLKALRGELVERAPSLDDAAPLSDEHSILEDFEGIGPADSDAALRLRRETLAATATRADLELLLPEHVGGDVAFLRMHLRYQRGAYDNYAERMIEARRNFDAEAIYREILDNGHSMHTIPGTAALHASSWETNYWLGVDNEGAVISFERWGSIDPNALLEKLSVERYERWLLFAFEARSMLLDLLSRRSKRVVEFTVVVDMNGVTLAHRKIMPYVKVFMAGESVQWASPPCWGGASYFVGFGTIASTFIKLAKAFTPRRLFESTALLKGNPFDTSQAFCNRFGSRMLPKDIGGEMSVEAVVDWASPGLDDKDALWELYQAQASQVRPSAE